MRIVFDGLEFSPMFLNVHTDFDIERNLLEKTISSPRSSRPKRTDAGEAEQFDWQ